MANVDDLRPEFCTAQSQFIQVGPAYNPSRERVGTGVLPSATIDKARFPRIQVFTGVLGGFKEKAVLWYSNQIMPFDITLSGATENRTACGMKLFGVKILDDGSGALIDDAVTEMPAIFVARLVEPWMEAGCRNAAPGDPGPGSTS